MSRPVLILDFGSQYTQLIARRIRELGVYAEIHPFNRSRSEIEAFDAGAIILSGGPNSVTDPQSPKIGEWIFEQAGYCLLDFTINREKVSSDHIERESFDCRFSIHRPHCLIIDFTS